MKKHLFQRIGAVCTGAVMSVSALMCTGASVGVSAAGSDDYAKLLQYSMYLYDANMCGTAVESTSGISWRGNCHTDDEVTGGFHDAGDHAIFGLPQGFTASTLGWSYYEFKDAYTATGQADHLKVIMDYFCDFFKKSTKLNGDSVSSFLYQKGDGKEDHSYWGAPEKQGGGRKMFWTSNSASDMAADYAAALALNYINFGNAEDLKYAEALYKFSTQHNAIESNGPSGFYLSEFPSCQDEQANAAGWLYLATKNESYKNDCASKQTQYLGWCDGWDNRGLGAACVYAHITGDWSKVNGYLGSLCNGGNYLCMDDWGSARLNCSVQFTALVASKNSNADYSSWCKGQMNYILGDNPFNICLVTGFASNSARNTHHRAASGYQGYNPPDGMNESTTTYHPTNSHVLIGALAGGPNKAGQYADVMNDYQCNEVALDYNAGLVGAAAGLYSVYKTGSTVSSIEGVKKIYAGGGTSSTTTTESSAQTTATQASQTSATTNTTTTKTSSTGGSGEYTVKIGDSYVYSQMGENDRMIGWDWADFNIPATEKVKKVEVQISTNKGSIGKWEGAFGTSTKVEPDYWTQTDNMSQSISGSSGTITWNVDSATADIIQYNYGGQLKFGVWWIDCDQFTVDSVKVYTDGSSSSVGTTAVSSTTMPTTTKTTTTTPSASGEHTVKIGDSYVYSQMGENDRMIGFLWEDFGIPATAKVKKVEVKISTTNGSIGKWEGAFGTSTKVDPDYWTQTDNMSQSISGNSGVITWNVDAATADIIQYNYGGELKFGVWWIDSDRFTIDSVTVYTDETTASTTASTTKATTTTTKATTTASTTTTSKTTTTTTTAKATKWGDANVSGVVDVSDAVLIARFSMSDDTAVITDQGKINADVTHDGKITSDDSLKVVRFIAGYVTEAELAK